jgi:GAF domain-containing protein
MSSAPLPHDEIWRLAALWDLNVLDSAPNPALDAIVKAASLVCGAPVGLISLVDEDRQWFKAKTGLEGVSETPRNMAFCAHTILSNEILQVEDTMLDPRFADNPLVVGAPFIRSYAGAPLVLQDGSKIGTLCAIDQQPKKLDARQMEILTELACAAARALEQARVMKIQSGLAEHLRECASLLDHVTQQPV